MGDNQDLSNPRSGQNYRLFRIYLIYRTLLSTVFVLLLVLPATRQFVGAQGQLLYTTVSLFFLLSNFLLLIAVAARWQLRNARLVLLLSTDIACITLLSDASGGMASGLPLLLTVSVAASAVLIANRTLATLAAALAVLALLGDTLRLVSTGQVEIRALLPAGLLGSLFFVVSAIVQLISVRLRRAEAVALARASDIQRLQRLNEEIVRRLQVGVLLIEGNGELRMLNDAARRLLLLSAPPGDRLSRSVESYSPELAVQLANFRRGVQLLGVPFQTHPDGPQVLVRFVRVDNAASGQVLAFIEDYAPLVAQAQALKLRSLGRLAGSIAHEIRNPLAAISHAAQLLQESEHIADQDRRMLDMVLGNSQRVNEIVESVLQVSRREPPQPQLLQLTSWLTHYCENRAHGPREDDELQLDYVDADARLLFDPEHLTRILDNLVDNAQRHSREATGRARAEIRARLDRERAECVLDVLDDGSGVDEADLPRLFEPFFTRSHRGSGLGLYLCRELCELNQARIAYLRQKGGGSCFRITAALKE
jgi:two-component system sensor histidine kinase PilS (NtrC family)